MGLGQGRQKFGYLPTPHTDSIFAVIGEELGLFGCTVVTVLFVVLFVRGFRISRQAPDSFGALLAAGITVWITFEALLNIAVMTAVLAFYRSAVAVYQFWRVVIGGIVGRYWHYVEYFASHGATVRAGTENQCGL